MVRLQINGMGCEAGTRRATRSIRQSMSRFRQRVAQPGSMQKTLDYICMQPTRQGQASHAHVNEIVAGLRRRGWQVRLIEPSHPRPGRADGIRRAVAAASTQLAYGLRCRFRPAPFVYIRAHFLTLPSALLAKAAGSIVVQEVNGPTSDVFDAWPRLRPFGRLLSLVGRAQLRWADAVVVVTPGLEGYLRDRIGRRSGYHVIGNGANTDLFAPTTDRPSTPQRPYAVFIGALASWQGIDTVLKAVGTADWPLDVDLVVAGDGKERDRIEEAARVNPHVRWLGTIAYDEAPALLSGSLAALVPMADVPRSSYGLSPVKLFEAMACGVPVVASDLPGLGDTVRAHDCGIIFPAGDAGALARSVALLSRDVVRAREMGSRGRRPAETLYSWDARAGQTEQVLLDLAGSRSTGVRPAGRRGGLGLRRRASTGGRPPAGG
jgi:glycosyltransferase involved in cell wall biosynthesis